MSEARGTGASEAIANTGVTTAQIEAAIDQWPDYQEQHRVHYRRIMLGYAADLVPVGARIFDKEDCAALGRTIAATRKAHDDYISAITLLYEKDRYLQNTGATVNQEDLDRWRNSAEQRWSELTFVTAADIDRLGGKVGG